MKLDPPTVSIERAAEVAGRGAPLPPLGDQLLGERVAGVLRLGRELRRGRDDDRVYD
jgi:hypothetical protein